MGKLANISGKEAVKAFQNAGLQPVGQVGSHLVMVKPGLRANLSVPQHRETLSRNAARIDPSRWADRRSVFEVALTKLRGYKF